MLQEFLSAISRSVSTTPVVNPYASGAGGTNIPIQSVFGKMLNNLLGAFTGNSSNMFNSTQGYGGQMQSSNPAIQAYSNSLAGGQGFFGAVQPQASQREAFSPGSVINTLQAPSLQMIPNSYSPISQLTNAVNPLQGFAGQAGAGGFALPGQFGAGGLALPGLAGQFIPGPYGATPNGAGGFGKLSMLLMPLVGLVGIVKSLFSLRGMGAMKPFQRDENSLVAYRNSLENYNKAQHTDGSFDEGNYWGEGEGEDSFDSSKLEI